MGSKATHQITRNGRIRAVDKKKLPPNLNEKGGVKAAFDNVDAAVARTYDPLLTRPYQS